MILKKFILSVKSANKKFENKFDSISKISANMLIFGQLFLVLILSAVLFYTTRASSETRVWLDIFKSIEVLFENAASGLFILWFSAIFIDYTEKNRS